MTNDKCAKPGCWRNPKAYIHGSMAGRKCGSPSCIGGQHPFWKQYRVVDKTRRVEHHRWIDPNSFDLPGMSYD